MSYANTLRSSRGGARCIHSTSKSPYLVHRTERNHDIDHGSHLHLLHRRYRRRSSESNERAFHPGVLQCNPKLRGDDHHDFYHRHHAYIRMHQRGSHGFAPALVVCSRSRIAVLALAVRCAAWVEHSLACSFCVSGDQLTSEPGRHWFDSRPKRHQLARCCQPSVQLYSNHWVSPGRAFATGHCLTNTHLS